MLNFPPQPGDPDYKPPFPGMPFPGPPQQPGVRSPYDEAPLSSQGAVPPMGTPPGGMPAPLQAGNPSGVPMPPGPPMPNPGGLPMPEGPPMSDGPPMPGGPLEMNASGPGSPPVLSTDGSGPGAGGPPMPTAAAAPVAPPEMPMPEDKGRDPRYRAGLMAGVEKADEGPGGPTTSPTFKSGIDNTQISRDFDAASQAFVNQSKKKTPWWKEALGITLNTVGLPQVGGKLTGDDEKNKLLKTAVSIGGLAEEKRKEQASAESSDLRHEQILTTKAWRDEANANELAALQPKPTTKERYLQALEIGADEETARQFAFNPSGVKQDKPEAWGTAPAGSTPYNKSTGELGKATPPKPSTDTFQSFFLPNYARSLGKVTPDGKGDVGQLTPEENTAAWREYKQDPDMKASILASRGLTMAMHQMLLSQQPTPEQAQMVAEDVVSHRIGPEQLSSIFGGFGAAGQTFKRMVYTAGKKLDPEFNYEQASAEYQLSKSPGFQNSIRYMDSVTKSLPQLLAAATRLANGKVRILNTGDNIYKAQTNNVDLAKFMADRTLVMDEVAKILSGGGTGSTTSDAKLTQALGIIKATDDPAVVAATIGEIQGLLGTRRSSLTKGTYLEHSGQSAAPTAPSVPDFKVLKVDK